MSFLAVTLLYLATVCRANADHPSAHLRKLRAEAYADAMRHSGLMHVPMEPTMLRSTLKGSTQLELYVDGVHGDDSNDGSKASPFRSLVKARDTMRNMSALPDGGIVVTVRGGDYVFTHSLDLTSKDSGNLQSPIMWTAAEGEKVRLLGGVKIPSASVGPSTAHAEAVAVDLKALGVDDYGTLQPGTLGDCANNKIELFIDGAPMHLARYPNIDSQGMWNFDEIVKPIDPMTAFQYNDTRAEGWTKATDMWLHGYWSFDWADSYVRVSSIDTDSSIFHIDPTTPPVYGFKTHGRYYAVNLIEELDHPEEYYVDRDTGILHFIPPASGQSVSEMDIVVSILPGVITLDKVAYVTFQGMQIAYSRGTGLVGNGCTDVTIRNCTAFNHGKAGIYLDGHNNTVDSCVVTGTGCGGISVSGGDIASLTSGFNLATDNTISHFARWKRTYQPALGWSGVGNSYLRNTISNGPHLGVLGNGNDCVFEGNHISKLAYEATDTGAFYTGRSWGKRGSILRGNVFESIRTTEHTTLGSPSVQAVYFDDQMSNWQVVGNSFSDCQKGVFIGGGRRFSVSDNVFKLQLESDVAVHVDNRGMNWQNDSCAPGGSLEAELIALQYQQPPWSTHYPALVNIMQDHPCVPCHNDIRNNVYSGVGKFLDASPENLAAWFCTTANNTKA